MFPLYGLFFLSWAHCGKPIFFWLKHSSPNFILLALLSHQKFHDRPLFKLGAICSICHHFEYPQNIFFFFFFFFFFFWKIKIIFVINQFQTIQSFVAKIYFAVFKKIPFIYWMTLVYIYIYIYIYDILLRHCNAIYNQNPIDRWMKGCILPFPKKGDLGLAKNYWGITLTSIAAKITMPYYETA